ncbi:MAG: hypothetical protein WBW62_08400 [Solirubrobacterales bacterium]
MNNKSLKLEFERRWALTASLAAVGGVALFFIGIMIGGSQAGSGVANSMINLQDSSTNAWIGTVLQSIGIASLAIPLGFLFTAALARSDRMRRGLIGVVVAAPIFFAIAGILSTATLVSASGEFGGASDPAVVKCVDEKKADFTEDAGTANEKPSSEDLETFQEDCENDVAGDLRNEAGLAGIAAGFGIAGSFGLIIGIVYTSLNAMRVGLLTRFWGSLGMALGAVSLLPGFLFLTLVWFLYVGLLFSGRIPGGRPPAWAAGVAIPWPDPRKPQGAESDDDVIDGTAEEVDDHEGTTAPEPDDAPSPQIERRKRKKRSDQ